MMVSCLILFYNKRMDKKDLRLKAKEFRTKADVEQASFKIVEQIKNLNKYKKAKDVLLFYPKGSELNLLDLCSEEKNFYLPRINGENLLICSYSCDVEMKLSHFKTLEPCSTPVSPDKIDFAIIPCLMADKKGYRLGYGGGFYDRLIPQLKNGCVKVCPVLSELVVEELPIEKFDRPVDIIVTQDYSLSAESFS